MTPLTSSESQVAQGLYGQVEGGGYTLADGNYDASGLFDRAGQQGYQLLVPMPSPHAGQGHHYQSPARVRCIERMHGVAGLTAGFGAALYPERGRIERLYGNAVSFGGGLAALPAWVRGLARVRTWVWAKLLINAMRILKNKHLHPP